MKLPVALNGVKRLFLDTAPAIYHVEGVVAYQPLMDAIIARSQSGDFVLVPSTITLAECLVHPYRRGDAALAQRFRDVLVNGLNTDFVGVDASAEKAAMLRAKYNRGLPDMFQVAAALDSACDGILTNDHGLKVVTELRVLILDELEL